MKTLTKEQFCDRAVKLCNNVLEDSDLYVNKFEDESFIIVESHEQNDLIEKLLNKYNLLDLLDFHYYDTITGFYDEYTTCSDCCEIIKTSPDSYCWQPDFILLECAIVCKKCVLDNKETYLDELIEEYINDSSKAFNSELFSIKDLLDDEWKTDDKVYQSGFHVGMDDNPEEIVSNLPDNKDFVFFVTNTSQFYVEFKILTRLNN